MIKPDRIGAFVVIAFGIGYLISAFTIPSATIEDPLGHRTFPMFLGFTAIILGFTILIRPEKDLKIGLKRSFISVLVILGALSAYGCSLEWMGYPLGTFLFLIIMARLLGERSWVINILLSAGLSIGVYLLFTNVMGLSLPLGVIQILTGK